MWKERMAFVCFFPEAKRDGENARTSIIRSAARRGCMGGVKQKIPIQKGKTGGPSG
jgi:hypothetical protein